MFFFAATGIRWNVPIAAWLWPAFILAFLRKNKNKSSLVFTLIAFVLLEIVKSYGVVDSGPIVNHLFGAVAGTIIWLPFLVDRLLAGRLRGVSRTLVLPLACVISENLQNLTPIGAIVTVSSMQADNKTLIQIASIFGAYGVTFIVMWLAPVVCEVAECLSVNGYREERLGENDSCEKIHDKGSMSFKKPLIAYVVVLLATLLLGGLRLTVAPVDSPAVKVALTTGPYVGDDFTEYDALATDVDYLQSLEMSARTAAGGNADILLFCEEAFSSTKTEEEAFITAASSVARQYRLPMIVSLEINDDEAAADGMNENKLVYINALGEQVFEYLKSKIIPIVEDVYVSGDGHIPLGILETASGTDVNLSTVICFDSDHASYIRDALPREAEILLIPTWDWDAIRAYHTKWVEYRAVENGVSLVRSTYNGVSTATDPYGRVTMYSDTASSGYENVVFAQVPINRVQTVYSALGNVIDVLYVVAFVALCGVAIVRGRKSVS